MLPWSLSRICSIGPIASSNTWREVTIHFLFLLYLTNSTGDFSDLFLAISSAMKRDMNEYFYISIILIIEQLSPSQRREAPFRA